MDISDDVLIAVALAVAEQEKQKKKKIKKKRLWMKEWHKKRPIFTHQNLLDELSVSSPEDFRNFLRFDLATFEELLQLVKPLIEKRDTLMRAPIPAEQRLSITLRHLATGNSFEDLKFTSAVSAQSIGNIVMETCEAIILVLKDYIKMPETAEEWKAIAEDFNTKWNFPNCLGAVDGKHVAIRKPENSGSFYYNYKKFFSVVLMAVVNANYELMVVDVGVNGRISDGGVLRHTAFGKKFYANNLNLPQQTALPNSERIVPYTFIGDDAFQLTENFMKPFSHTGLSKEQRIFNYRLSRARRIVENVFGILVSRFGVLQRTINLAPEKVQTIVLTCCYLHNYLRKRGSFTSNGEDLHNRITVEDASTQNLMLHGLQSTISRNSGNNAKKIRQQFCDYFNNEGQVPWQNDYC